MGSARCDSESLWCLVGLSRRSQTFFNEPAHFIEVIVQGIDDGAYSLKEVLGSEELDTEAAGREGNVGW